MFHDPRQICLDLGLPIQTAADRKRLLMVRLNMIRRCYGPSRPASLSYSERGIKVCDEWRNDREAFIRFALANGWRRGLEIDRRDNDGNYEPGNVWFTTRRVNSLNRRNTIRLANGSPAWPLAERNGISYNTFHARVFLGWSPYRAATTPLQVQRPLLSYRLADGRRAIEVATASGLNRDTVRHRIRRGWSLERACGLPPPDLTAPAALCEVTP